MLMQYNKRTNQGNEEGKTIQGRRKYAAYFTDDAIAAPAKRSKYHKEERAVECNNLGVTNSNDE